MQIYSKLPIKKTDIVFDIGAHEGNHTRAFLNAYGCVVFCFEANDILAHDLIEQFENEDRVQVIPYAVSDTNGMVQFYLSSATTISSCEPTWGSLPRWGAYEFYEPISVPCLTLDYMIGEVGVPAYIKIDVEGHEHAVLAGLTQKAGIISFEFVNDNMDNLTACIRHLNGLGYTKFNLVWGEGETGEFVRPRPTSGADIAAIVAQSKGDTYGNIFAFP